MNNQGAFSLTSNDETSPSLGCTSTLYMSGTVSGPGCLGTANQWSLCIRIRGFSRAAFATRFQLGRAYGVRDVSAARE